MSDIAYEINVHCTFKFVSGHGARTYMNGCKNKDKQIVCSIFVSYMSQEVLCA